MLISINILPWANGLLIIIIEQSLDRRSIEVYNLKKRLGSHLFSPPYSASLNLNYCS